MEEEVATGTSVPEEVGVSSSRGGGERAAREAVAVDEDLSTARVVRQLPELEGSWRSIMRKWGNGEYRSIRSSSRADLFAQRAAGRLVGRTFGFRMSCCLLN